MTRLESSARDYAIALLARGHDADWVIDRVLPDMDELDTVRRLPWPWDGLPFLRARLALYLRLLRRVEAWEAEGCQWSGWAAPPWRPLWTSAPPHEPGVTAMMRRER